MISCGTNHRPVKLAVSVPRGTALFMYHVIYVDNALSHLHYVQKLNRRFVMIKNDLLHFLHKLGHLGSQMIEKHQLIDHATKMKSQI